MTYAIKFVVSFLEERLGKRVAKQIIYILLLAFDVERKKIREIFGASDVTLCKYNAAIRDENLEKIFENNNYRPESELETYREKIEKEFEANPPGTRRQAAIKIEKITGIKRGLTQVGIFLKKGGSKINL